jgi:hypothetical protein
LLACAGVSLGLQASEVEALRTTMLVPAGVCLVLSIVGCREIGDGDWRVDRPGRPSSAAST